MSTQYLNLNIDKGHRSSDVNPSNRSFGHRVEITGMDSNITEPYRFMFTPMRDRIISQEIRANNLLNQFCTKLELNRERDITPVGIPRQESVIVMGRVCLEGNAKKLSDTTIWLEGTRNESNGRMVKLDLSEIRTFSIFPGQILVCEGLCSSGKTLVVKRLFAYIQRPSLKSPTDLLLRYHHNTNYLDSEAMSLMIASGPYTYDNDLDYTPFNELLFNHVITNQPDVLILCGPFISANHPLIEDGEIMISNEIADAYTLFLLRISESIKELYKSNPHLITQIILIPSLEDVQNDFIFPQPPLHNRFGNGRPSPFFPEEKLGSLEIPYTNKNEKRVHCFSNPSLFNINEVNIGVSTNDILFDLSLSHSYKNVGNHMGMLLTHILGQQSFYPLYPPPENNEAEIDLHKHYNFSLPVQPDILILPSKLSPFVRNINGCICINPGKICRGNSLGKLAQVSIHPLPKDTLNKNMSLENDMMNIESIDSNKINNNDQIDHQIIERTCVEIVSLS